MDLSVLFRVSNVPVINNRCVHCKGREMGEDHKYDNVYFLIGGITPHGKLIVCSHHACIKSGCIFLYCAVCQLPCAKRTFSRRHLHGSLFQHILKYDQHVPIDTPCEGNRSELGSTRITLCMSNTSKVLHYLSLHLLGSQKKKTFSKGELMEGESYA